jgi:hypothetical protein
MMMARTIAHASTYISFVFAFVLSLLRKLAAIYFRPRYLRYREAQVRRRRQLGGRVRALIRATSVEEDGEEFECLEDTEDNDIAEIGGRIENEEMEEEEFECLEDTKNDITENGGRIEKKEAEEEEFEGLEDTKDNDTTENGSRIENEETEEVVSFE